MQTAFSNEFDWQNCKAIIILFKRVSLFSCHQSSGRVHSHEEICVYLGFHCCHIYCKFAVELHGGFYEQLPAGEAVLTTSK